MDLFNQDLWIKIKPLLIAVLSLFYMFVLFNLSGIASAADNKGLKSSANYPEVEFAVVSDIHLFDINNNVNHPYYSHYNEQDREILGMSDEILERTVDNIRKKEMDFVVITGDLTDIGDFQSHYLLANILQQLQDEGIKVYVIPGNHDGFIVEEEGVQKNNGNRNIISPGDFTNIYNNFGYKEAIYRDDNSLSYVVDPIAGLWLILIDSCIYDKDRYHVTGGRIKETTNNWIIDILKKAHNKNKSLMGFMHHGILEHFKGQQKFFSEYLVADGEQLASEFASNNLQFVFTGHNHALDIVKQEFKSGEKGETNFLYDIETSSLIGYPNAYRLIKINENQELYIKTEYIKELPSFAGDFSNYAKNYVKNRIKDMVSVKLSKFKVKEKDKEKIYEQVSAAILAHYEGNETPPENLKIDGINFWSRIVMHFYKELINGLYQDLEPEDINIKVDLETGEWEGYKPGQ
ncbi:MAG: metallophosphoesterase family protein, partial [Halanaerobiales bacterium]